MHEDLERRLRAAYPSGEICGLSEDALMNSERDTHIAKALKFITANAPLFCAPEPFDKPAYRFTFTQLDHPKFSRWRQMDNPAKLKWIKKAGEPYPVLWLKISRIADFFDYFFNLWTPRDDTGYLNADWSCESPNSPWASHLRIVQATLAEYGFEPIADDLARTDVPFITDKDYESVPDNDPRWEDDSFEPPDRPVSVYECIFGS